MTGTGGLQRVPKYFLKNYAIPLPTIDTQRGIISGIKKERSIIDSNTTLIARFEAKIAARIKRVWEAG